MRLVFSRVDDGGYVFEIGGREIKICSPLDIDPAFDDMDFDFFLLYRSDLKESDVQEFCIKRGGGGRRIGLVIPVNALTSLDHDFSDKGFFLQYAHTAMSRGLVAVQDKFNVGCEELDEEFSISDVFSDECAFLIISKSVVLPEDDFSIERCLPSLLSYGYVIVGDDGISEIRQGSPREAAKKILVKMNSKELEDDGFIGHFINRALSRESSSQFEFFYIYQIFEFLLDKVFCFEQEALVEELVDVYGDLQKTKQVIAKIQDSSSEKKLLAIMVEKYISAGIDFSGLRDSCNLLLGKLGREEGANLNQFLYSVRNFIFHQYRDFPENCKGELDEVVSELYRVLPDILSGFSRTSRGA